jgi:hypothetical protein
VLWPFSFSIVWKLAPANCPPFWSETMNSCRAHIFWKSGQPSLSRTEWGWKINCWCSEQSLCLVSDGEIIPNFLGRCKTLHNFLPSRVPSQCFKPESNPVLRLVQYWQRDPENAPLRSLKDSETFLKLITPLSWKGRQPINFETSFRFETIDHVKEARFSNLWAPWVGRRSNKLLGIIDVLGTSAWEGSSTSRPAAHRGRPRRGSGKVAEKEMAEVAKCGPDKICPFQGRDWPLNWEWGSRTWKCPWKSRS